MFWTVLWLELYGVKRDKLRTVNNSHPPPHCWYMTTPRYPPLSYEQNVAGWLAPYLRISLTQLLLYSLCCLAQLSSLNSRRNYLRRSCVVALLNLDLATNHLESLSQ